MFVQLWLIKRRVHLHERGSNSMLLHTKFSPNMQLTFRVTGGGVDIENINPDKQKNTICCTVFLTLIKTSGRLPLRTKPFQMYDKDTSSKTALCTLCMLEPNHLCH